jgi:hypothetical protein
MTEAGCAWDRSVVANFEGGRRQSVTVDEMIALGVIFDVPPWSLVDDSASGPAEPLTPAEHRAMDLTVELRNVIRNEIITEGAGARQDRAELAADIHRIQHRILRQAAARAYPDRYRLLGGWPDDDGTNT